MSELNETEIHVRNLFFMIYKIYGIQCRKLFHVQTLRIFLVDFLTKLHISLWQNYAEYVPTRIKMISGQFRAITFLSAFYHLFRPFQYDCSFPERTFFSERNVLRSQVDVIVYQCMVMTLGDQPGSAQVVFSSCSSQQLKK